MPENILPSAQDGPQGETQRGPDAGGETQKERRARYDRLIKEEFRDLYTDDTQRLINKRFRELHELREKFDSQSLELSELKARQTPEKPDYSPQIEAMKARLPDFDFQRELEHPAFAALIEKGAELETAWRAAHHEELLRQAVAQAGLDAERRVASHIACRGAMPRESAGGVSGGLYRRRDMASLTRADRAEAARRALKGERIRF